MLAQGGEFAFVLLSLACQVGIQPLYVTVHALLSVSGWVSGHLQYQIQLRQDQPQCTDPSRIVELVSVLARCEHHRQQHGHIGCTMIAALIAQQC